MMAGLASNSTNANTTTSLRLRQAILANDIPLVERLLHAKPRMLYNPDFNDKSNTSLHLAAQAGHAELAEYLISQGHDSRPEVTDLIYSNDGTNSGISVNTDGQTPLHLAASFHHAEVIEILCTEFPDTVDRGDRCGSTPLLLAAGRQAPSSTRPVAGRKTTAPNTEGVEAIEILLRHGAAVTAQDSDGNTCLHQACAWGNLKTVRALVQAGADPLARNHKGFSPDAYSLTVQADVYFRNLVAESERRRAEELLRKRERRAGGGGPVRLVQDDEPEQDFDQSRYRADSGRSTTFSDDSESSASGLGISTNSRPRDWM